MAWGQEGTQESGRPCRSERTGCRGGGSGAGPRREEIDVEAHGGLEEVRLENILRVWGSEVVGNGWRKGSGRSQVGARKSRREGRETEGRPSK